MLTTAAYAADKPLDATGHWSVTARGNAPLPPMGWNSWNAFNSDVDETKLMAAAQALVDTGLARLGYRYVDIDDGWWLRRRTTDNRLMIRTANFPSARTVDEAGSFRPLTNRLHAMGLKAGIYSDIGRNSCGQAYTSQFANQPEGTVAEREVGLYGHIEQDIALFLGEWNFDLVKVDGCGIRAMSAENPLVASGRYRELRPLIDYETLPNNDVATVRVLYQQVADAMHRTRPANDYVFSLCLWGAADVRSWAGKVGNMSRTSEDISPNWERMLHNLDAASRRELYAHPNSWNDADMLFVGSGEFDMDHMVEARSHMTLWAMLNSPLIIGFDMRKATPALVSVLGNPHVVALNQDKAGNQAVLAYDGETVQIFVKTLADGTKAVALFNRSGSPVDVKLTAAHLKYRVDRSIALTDLWDGGRSSFQGETPVHLDRHQTLLFKAVGVREHPQGLYLSEQPGSVNPAVDGIVHPMADPLVHRGLLPWRSTRGDGEHPLYGGWGGARADATPFAQTPKMAGKTYPSSIGILANSRLEIRNNGFATFSALAGVDDATADLAAQVRFSVHVDGKRMFQSAWMKRGQQPVPIKVPIKGARIVELVAEGDHPVMQDIPVNWAMAALDW
ncbi:NPCBM/NEW2 domain-containing protein [Novosphingobium cyanobacteriorum]|uniref:Alpha-galactosidase n=1 Tax=Novosphingobium cyanobacteriorum TaxID=3024215 RepID=A0ABT6CK92_9SPHN|nr:NPCBM/NEW2 domain-containing protein [Novosphingobium cyanobacteriorum]MDF8332762.1 NPCBM/NEW2 domain-containing protein [Novosphingobium cyanobacteriorum]